jgi:mannitol 2-dehydrogenase
MSCDNIQGNGHMAQEVFAAFARLRDPELGDWVEDQCPLPELDGRPNYAGDHG